MLSKARSAINVIGHDVSRFFSSTDGKETPETSSSSSPPPSSRESEGLSVGSTVLCEAPLDSDDDESEDEDSEDFSRPLSTSELCAELGECAPLALTLTHGSYHNLRKLARAIQSGVYVLIITGAGVSVASGIKTYRTGVDGVWNNFVYEWGTKKKFMEDPSAWWTDFWFRSHDTKSFKNAQPSAAHYAIASIMKQYTHVRLATQNIDRLHKRAGVDPKRLAEVHGALGLYRCTNHTCKFSKTECIEGVEFTNDKDGRVIPPRCPDCGSLVLPMTLLFDEMYSSHTFFKNDVVSDWLDRAEVFIFAGTSLSVGITSAALHTVAMWNAEAYSMNVEPQHRRIPSSTGSPTTLHDIVGPSEVTLPILAQLCCTQSSSLMPTSCNIQ